MKRDYTFVNGSRRGHGTKREHQDSSPTVRDVGGDDSGIGVGYKDSNLTTQNKRSDYFSLNSIYMHEIKMELLTHEQEIEFGKKIEPMMNVRAQIKEIESAIRKLKPHTFQEDAGQKKVLDAKRKEYQKEELRLLPVFEEARNEFVVHNLRLVISIGKKYLGRGLTFQDIVQEGNTGLMIAAGKYSWRHGYRFSTYASWWIRQSIARSIITDGSEVRLPSYIYEVLPKIMAIHNAFLTQHGCEPSYEELAGLGDCTAILVERVLTTGNRMISLESHPEGDPKLLFKDILPSSDTPIPIQVFNAIREKEIAKILKKALDPRERDVIRKRIILDMTLEEIANGYDLSRERIRQIERQAFSKLKQRPWRKQLESYL